MSTVAYQGRGSHLAVSDDSIAYTNIAQLQKFAFAGLSATLEDVTNLDSPTAFKEWLPTIIDPKDITYSGILNPADATTNDLATRLQNFTLTHFKVTLTDGTTITFDGFVTDHVPVSVDYAKALTFSGKVQITSGVTITPA